ncbi:hypothetical protein BC937DRAFT_91897 [Endogone sp. FLAS-F59071]|nr:hypothetical protein BC937DRAFT_91897 [Endogone sp. FLAS-F59071]|eukprot:RUS15859.1 hypothetical protein BC937DRAFT_91897 [Endogone sp. FLAS-F59071]
MLPTVTPHRSTNTRFNQDPARTHPAFFHQQRPHVTLASNHAASILEGYDAAKLSPVFFGYFSSSSRGVVKEKSKL